MTAPKNKLKLLLSGELPLERVGPHLRYACRRALLSGDQERMRLAAKVVLTELARRGDLVKVSIEDTGDVDTEGGPFYLVKGSHSLLDLSVLGRDALEVARPPAPFPIDPDTAAEPLVVPSSHGGGLDAFAGMLGAMEQAQDLEISDPRSGEKVIILTSILRLL